MIEGLGKAAENLSLIMRDALGIYIEPAKKKRMAQAEMEIEEKRLFHNYDLEKIDLAERAKLRIFETGTRRQQNLEKIGAEAVSLLPETATPEKINIDWLHHFADSAKDVSEEELRKLWAQILSQEATEPGKFSKRTLDYLKNFSVYDCELFEKLLPFIFMNEENLAFFIVPKSQFSTFKEKYQIGLFETLHLKNIGLCSTAESGLSFSIAPDEPFKTLYFGKLISIYNPTNNQIIIYDAHFLSEAGNQLFSVLDVASDTNEMYFHEIMNLFTGLGLEIDIED